MNDDLLSLVPAWLTLPEAAELLATDIGKVRRMLQDRQLIGARIGERRVLSIPAALIQDGNLLEHLPGTLVVLADSGYDDEAALRWLFTPDTTLPATGTPVDALRAGWKTEVRRRAQALAF